MDKIRYLELKVPPVAVFIVFAVLLWLVAKAIPLNGFALPGRKLIAAGVAAVAGAFAAAGIGSFLRARTTLDPRTPGKTAALVTGGVYTITRNPLYLSLLLLLAGWAIWLANPVSLVCIPFFVAYMNTFQVKPEERALAALFGGEFEEYCRRVRRWL